MILTPAVIFLAGLVVVVIAIIVLTIIEKNLSRKVIIKRKEENTYFQRRIRGIDDEIGDPNVFLNSIDEIAREFFSEKFGVDKNEKYSVLIEQFKKQDNVKATAFCEGIQEIYYGGNSIKDEKLKFLFDTLNSFIEEDANNKLVKSQPKKEKSWLFKEYEPNENQAIADEVRIEPSEQITVQKEHGESFSEGLFSKFRSWNEKSEKKRKFEQMRKQSMMNESNLIKEKEMKRVEEEKMIREAEIRNQEMIRRKISEESQIKPLKVKEIQEVPLEREKIAFEKVERPEREPRSQRNIRSIDDLDRLKEKIKERRRKLPFEQQYTELCQEPSTKVDGVSGS